MKEKESKNGPLFSDLGMVGAQTAAFGEGALSCFYFFKEDVYLKYTSIRVEPRESKQARVPRLK